MAHLKDHTKQDLFTDITIVVMITEITNIMTNMINTTENTTDMTMMMIIDTEVQEEDNIKLLSFNRKRVSKLLILSFF